jgi:hypothetical protein
LAHAYGIVADPKEIVFNGIQNIQVAMQQVAAEKHMKSNL